MSSLILCNIATYPGKGLNKIDPSSSHNRTKPGTIIGPFIPGSRAAYTHYHLINAATQLTEGIRVSARPGCFEFQPSRDDKTQDLIFTTGSASSKKYLPAAIGNIHSIPFIKIQVLMMAVF